MPIAPVSPPELTSWNNTFSWTGVNGATYYLLEVYDGSNTRILNQWFSTSAAGCDSDTSCDASPTSLATLGNGDYTWRVRDYAGLWLWSLDEPDGLHVEHSLLQSNNRHCTSGSGDSDSQSGAELWGQLCSGDGGEVDGSGE